MKIGAAAIVFESQDLADLKRDLDVAMPLVPSGRHLFLTWRVAQSWEPSLPIESYFITESLGRPALRTDEEWEFFGNGAVRLYGPDLASPREVIVWCGVRRLGDKPYIRRKKNDDSISILEQTSRLHRESPAFTRDVANNVWHLKARQGMNEVLRRLQSLHTWSDESFLIIRNGRVKKTKHRQMNLDDALIPIATKPIYDLPKDFPVQKIKGTRIKEGFQREALF